MLVKFALLYELNKKIYMQKNRRNLFYIKIKLIFFNKKKANKNNTYTD